MDEEKYRYKNLSYQELVHLKGIYKNRLIHINKQLAKGIDGQEICELASDIISRCGFHSPHLDKECKIIAHNYENKWNNIIGQTDHAYMPYAIAASILSYYNYEMNPYDLIEQYDLDKKKYYRLLLKVKTHLHRYYWQDGSI